MKTKLRIINPNAGGIDIGSEKIFVCANDSGYKSFDTFTEDLRLAAAYLKDCTVNSVAMEATGVYWLPVKDILESEGIEVTLVRAGDANQLPGREKTDGEDCQWIRTLHQHGLLRPCFIPEEIIRELRTIIRLRQDHIEMAAAHIQHMQKAFTLMNLRLHQVISQIQGVSGRRIIESILNGERDAETLTMLCDKQIVRNKKEEVMKSLNGNYREEYLFMLGQAYKAWNFYNQLITECDKKIESWFIRSTNNKPEVDHITPEKSIRHHKPDIENFHAKTLRLTEGKDASQLPGLTDYSVVRIIAEVGLDLKEWKSDKNFVSWLGLAPKRYSSGKMRRRYKGKQHTAAAQIFKEAAQSLLNSKHIGLGSFARKVKSRKGPQIAIKATARKIAVLYYNAITKGMEYVEKGIKEYDSKAKQTEIQRLTKQASRLGFALTEALVHQ
jgi:transposase